MGIEQRRGRPYYYRKRRIGRRVVSEYQGSGVLSELDYLIDAEKRARQQTQHAADQAQIAAWRHERAATDQMLGQLDQLTRTITRMILLSNGYHQHKGTWRRKREHTRDTGI